MTVQPLLPGDDGQRATAELPSRWSRFAHLASERLPELAGALAEGAQAIDAIALLERQRRGPALPRVEGTPEVLAAALTALARADTALERAGEPALAITCADLTLAVAVWALRHDLPVDPPEPVVNALARRGNATREKPGLHGLVHLMAQLADNLGPRLAADLERSNPQRLWRVLHANLAITAIRTEEGEVIDAAFDRLDAALPDERAGFYAEALALAMSPAIPEAVRERIRARHLKWTADR